MVNVYSIISRVPFFSHLTPNEVSYLLTHCRETTINKGKRVDLSASPSLSIVKSGLFEIDTTTKKIMVYLSQGSFFGSIPFSDFSPKGTIKAVSDCEIIIIDDIKIKEFFLLHFRAFRGYIKALEKLNFLAPDSYFKKGGSANIISFYSSERASGTTIITSVVASALSKKGKTVVLDCSYSGNSLFSVFGKKVTAPVSQKGDDDVSFEIMIKDGLQECSENLHILNISFGSQVKVDPEIINPLLFILSRKYDNIIFDIRNEDVDFRNKIVQCSDIIINIIKNKKQLQVESSISSLCKEGQRVFTIFNSYYNKGVSTFEGGFIVPEFDFSHKDPLENLFNIADLTEIGQIIRVIDKKKRVMVLGSLFLNAPLIGGLFSNLNPDDFDYIYSSSFSSILMLMYLSSKNHDFFYDGVKELFSEIRMNSFLDISYPDKFVVKKGAYYRYFDDIVKKRNLENFAIQPLVKVKNHLTDEGEILSSGSASHIMTASASLYPLFEGTKLNDSLYWSGYPDQRALVEDMLRLNVDEIYSFEVHNRNAIKMDYDRMPVFFHNYYNSVNDDQNLGESPFAQRQFSITASFDKLKPGKMMNNSEELWNKCLKDFSLQ